eukprot:11323-Heterococcus_DN1.PRE.3
MHTISLIGCLAEPPVAVQCASVLSAHTQAQHARACTMNASGGSAQPLNVWFPCRCVVTVFLHALMVTHCAQLHRA